MKKLIFVITLIAGFIDSALAESWLCISEAMAGVTTSTPFISAEVEAGQKYLVVINKESNEVELKHFGKPPIKHDCGNNSEAISCKYPEGYFGSEFFMSKIDSTFWYSFRWQTSKGEEWLYAASGKCSTI